MIVTAPDPPATAKRAVSAGQATGRRRAQPARQPGRRASNKAGVQFGEVNAAELSPVSRLG